MKSITSPKDKLFISELSQVSIKVIAMHKVLFLWKTNET